MQTVEQLQPEVQGREESPTRVFNECLGYHFKELRSSRLLCPSASCRRGPCHQLPNAGWKHGAQMRASVGSEELRGAGSFPPAGNSHPTALSSDGSGPGQQRAGPSSGTAQLWPSKERRRIQLSGTARTHRHRSLTELPWCRRICMIRIFVIRNYQWKHFTHGECLPSFSARLSWHAAPLVFSLRHFGELVI